MDKQRLGRRGEQEAARLLRGSGYRILARNFRTRLGEIDLVAREGDTLCFVEVRARSDSDFGWPEETVDYWKQRRLIRLAQGYLKAHRLGEAPIRFDVVSVLVSPDGSALRTRLIKSAFEAS